MPMPQQGTQWPPKSHEQYFKQLRLWDALYTGNAGYLRDALGDPGEQRREGVVQQVTAGISRAFNRRPKRQGQDPVKLHLPTPADIAQFASSVLFSEPPQVIAVDGDDSTLSDDQKQVIQDRIAQVVMTDDTFSELVLAAEYQSALGGVYLRLDWSQVLDHVIMRAVPADAAVPEFENGVLTGVTFWGELTSSSSSVWRLMEHRRVGAIEYALFQGSISNLGMRVPFTDHPEAAYLADVVNENSEVPAEVDGITVAYIPNRLPNKQFRRNPALQRLGSSDFAGSETLFDQIDSVYSSLMRDVRLGKARAFVPASMLDKSNQLGEGASFDFDREFFVPVPSLTGPQGQSNVGIQVEQPEIRIADHEQTLKALKREAFVNAGYSPASLAEAEGATSNRTATEVNADEKLTAFTRDTKIAYWRALGPFMRTWLDLDSLVYGRELLPPADIQVKFAASTQVDEAQEATTISLLDSGGAISTEQKVRRLHPEWDDQAIDEEVKRIKAERSVPAPDGATSRGLFDDMRQEDENVDR